MFFGHGMVEEGDEVTAGRKPRIAHVAGRFIEHLPRRKFQAAESALIADDSELRAVGGPVCLLHRFENLAGRLLPSENAPAYLP